MDRSVTERVSVEEAARLLGIKEESVRKRVSRGKLRADKDEEGRLLVYVERSQTVRDEYGDQSRDQSQGARDELVDQMRERIDDLREQLEGEREARRRADTIIAQLTQANATLASRIPELEAPPQPQDQHEPNAEGAESPAEGAASGTPPPGSEGSSEGDIRRPWWRRVFGG